MLPIRRACCFGNDDLRSLQLRITGAYRGTDVHLCIILSPRAPISQLKMTSPRGIRYVDAMI